MTRYRPRMPKLSFSLPSSSRSETTWRQRRLVRQAAHETQEAVTDRLKTAPFLSSSSSNEPQTSTSMERLPIVSRNDVDVRFWVGRGGFCDAFEVAPILGKDNKMVLKRLRSSLVPSSADQESFVLAAVDLRLEALYLSQLSHPHIVELLGVVQPRHGLPYADGLYDGFGLLLESLGDTLDERLEDWERQQRDQSGAANNSKMQHLEKALLYASQVADALEYLHERRIVLCDVKPSNIGFCQDDDMIKLFDFGLCRELPPGPDDCLYTLPLSGTPTYLPPEAWIHQRYNCLTDVYAWAILLHQMVSLQPPYQGYSHSDHRQRVAVGGERPLLDGIIPDCLHSLLQHAWDGNLSQRSSMAEARRELDLARWEMGYSLNGPEVKHCASVSSNMDSLVYGLEDNSSNEQTDWDGGVAGGGEEDFENLVSTNEIVKIQNE